MDEEQRKELIRQRAVAKASLTRMQNYVQKTNHNLHDLQVRFDELPNIFNEYDIAQSELEWKNDTDFSVDRQQFEEQYFDVKAKFHELLHPAVDTMLRDSSPSGSGQGQTSPNASNRLLIKLPEIKLPSFSGDV
jgi:hypothetical protein